NTCENNNGNGIRLYRSSDCTIENNTISENRVGIYLESSSRDNTAHYNTIFNSTEYGINATDNNGYTINATNNWWGAASGPFHSSENPGGEGDNITDYVLFDPWLTEPGNHPPTANAGNNQTVYTNEEVRFMGTGDDPDGTIEKFEWDFDGDGTFDWSSLTTGETTHSYPLKGTYHAVLRVTDDKGATATDDCTITVNDNIKPTIMITSHANNSEISGKVTIKGTAADTDGTIEKVEISIDDGDWEIVNGIYSWDHEWDTTTLENGEYSLKFRAYDGTDFSEVKEIVLNVQKPAPENKKPTVSITSPKDGDKVKGKLTITGTSSGKNCTNRTYKLYQSFGNNDFLVSTGNLGSVISADYLLLDDRGIAVPGVQGSVKDIYGLNLDDEYTNVSFQDNDRDGRISSGDAFLVKNRINGGQAEADYSLVLKCNKVDKVEISINNGPWITVTGTESWSIEWDTKDIENGEYTIKVRSYDGKNYSDVKSITVKVENKDDDDGGGGFIPGFGAGLLVGAIGLTTILFLKRKKSRRVNYY
ncbi:MAG: right-handed parallel beta-helix repeat-containing protein, partial [Thermoplasmata archaeon]|nr:right-handed parallel beta-helix repeat-containing protein [Thermoplasmata archaeon]